VTDWENEANKEIPARELRSLSQDCSHRIEILVNVWDNIIPPGEIEEYHTWMGEAMQYEGGGFEAMNYYYELNLT